MNIWDGLLQGIIQGMTEFLPISSSGHLSLYQYFTGNSGEGSLFFNLMLHMGTLAAVVAAYYEDLWGMLKEVGRMLKEIAAGQFSLKTDNPDRKMLFMLVVACLPMVLLIPLKKFVANISGDRDIVVEGIAFLLTSLLLFAGCAAKRGKAGIRKMRPKQAVTVGVVQTIAAIPGLSRSGSTISTGLILGFDRAFMVKFSFLLGIPAILGGAIFEIGDVVKEKVEISFWPLFLGMLAAAATGYICIRLVRGLLVNNHFKVFAWYTLVLGVVVLIVGIIGHIKAGGTASDISQAANSVVSSISQAASTSGT